MVLVFALLCAIPALVVWLLSDDFTLGLGSWVFLMLQSIVWFAWATAAPLNMVLGMEFFISWSTFWTWHNLFRKPKTRKPLQQIILSGSNLNTTPRPPLFGYSKAARRTRFGLYVSTLMLVAVCGYVFLAWMSGVPTFIQSPFDQSISDGAMKRNETYSTSPQIDYQEGQYAPPPKPSTKSWSDTDDLSDWGKYVKP